MTEFHKRSEARQYHDKSRSFSRAKDNRQMGKAYTLRQAAGSHYRRDAALYYFNKRDDGNSSETARRSYERAVRKSQETTREMIKSLSPRRS